MMDKIEELKAVASNEKLNAEERGVAAKLLETLEKPKPPKTMEDHLEEMTRRNEAKDAAYRADQLARFKVCVVCALKQDKDAEVCGLCGATDKWESPLPDSPERREQIAITTDWADDQLNERIARDSSYTTRARVKHCIRILELRDVPRVRSFWERAGFDIDGKPRTTNPAPQQSSHTTLYAPIRAAQYE